MDKTPGSEGKAKTRGLKVAVRRKPVRGQAATNTALGQLSGQGLALQASGELAELTHKRPRRERMLRTIRCSNGYKKRRARKLSAGAKLM